MAIINGKIGFVWADTKVILFDMPIIPITKFNYEMTRDGAFATLIVYTDFIRKIIDASPEKNPLAIKQKFDVTFEYKNGIGETVVDVFKNARFENVPFSCTNGFSEKIYTYGSGELPNGISYGNMPNFVEIKLSGSHIEFSK